MARFYSNENLPRQILQILRELGHDVLTSAEAGNANRSVPDEEVLRYAASNGRILLTQNRIHFLRLHQRRTLDHAGMVLCTFDPDFAGQARRIAQSVAIEDGMTNKLTRVHRPSK